MLDWELIIMSEHDSESVKESGSIKIPKKTLVLSISLIVVFVVGFFVGDALSGNFLKVSEAEAVQSIQSFLSSNSPGTRFTANEKVIENGMYKISGTIGDGTGSEPITVYVSLDGQFLFPQAISLDEQAAAPAQPSQPQQTITKSDKPVVELFVMSHCPYGTQAEKGIIPVAELLGDKIDFSIKFVDYAMHGEIELDEQLLQVCIAEEQSDKYFDYLSCFLEDGDTERCLEEVDIDSLEDCIERVDEEFKIKELFADQSTWSGGRYPQFNVHKAENDKYGVGGSPTLIINGQQVSSGRDSESYLATICSAFNSPVEECGESLSGVTPSAGFGSGSGAGSNSAATCG